MIKTLAKIQRELIAPKSKYNSFGKYAYRSVEDIMQAVKPLLGDNAITINDEIVMIGERVYVKATATIQGENGTVSATGYAREALTKKGMDEAQITGSASSYARKYALNALLAIDDSKEVDESGLEDDQAIKAINECKTEDELKSVWNGVCGKNKVYIDALTERKAEIKKGAK